MADLRIGIVGSGSMAGHRLEAFQSLEGVQVTSIAARNIVTGPRMAEANDLDLVADWRELILRQDIDAIGVFTHNEIHGEICLAALDAGKHVFTEYPITRSTEEAAQLEQRLDAGCPVISVAHGETVSAQHAALRLAASSLGPLMFAMFTRLTPGRGARPEVLFNLDLSGPPTLFFVYHVYALVDLFGPASWVDCGAEYVGLKDDGGYQRFANALTVGFERGGIASWNWAGGIEVAKAEQTQRIVMEKGTLVRSAEGWKISTRGGEHPVETVGKESESLEERFLRHVTTGDEGWKQETRVAVQAARIGLAAEVAVTEERRVDL